MAHKVNVLLDSGEEEGIIQQLCSPEKHDLLPALVSSMISLSSDVQLICFTLKLLGKLAAVHH